MTVLDRRETLVAQYALLFECSYCLAAARQPCYSLRSGKPTRTHAPRTAILHELFTLGWEAGRISLAGEWRAAS